MPHVLITGANRGIGLEFARQYGEAGWKVMAACRNPDAADELRALDGDISIQELNYDDLAGIDALAKQAGIGSLDLLILNAGLNVQANAPLEETDYEQWHNVFQANVIGPFRTANAFADQVAASDQKTIAVLGSMAGSFSIDQPGNYVYRTTKAGLHNAMKYLAQELLPKGIKLVVMHPGRVRNSRAPNNPLEARVSVSSMRDVFEKLTENQAGTFLNYDGKELPW